MSKAVETAEQKSEKVEHDCFSQEAYEFTAEEEHGAEDIWAQVGFSFTLHHGAE